MGNVIEIIVNEIKKFLNEEDYKMWHKAPNPDNDDAPMHNLTVMYPDNIYSNNAARFYKHFGDDRDVQAINIIQSTRNQPNKLIKIYRAVPLKDKKLDINNGNWVTITPDYARQHAKSNIDGQYQIVSKTVSARNLYNEGNSIFEWGYYVN